MFIPIVFARIEKTHDLFRYRVEARNIWPFVVVAVETGEREIQSLGLSGVFLGDDVIDLEGSDRKALREMTILAPPIGSIPNLPFEPSLHLRWLSGSLL
jgi:hypothetical protein